MLENGSKNISVLGSTGSIGRQTLEVCEKLGIRVSALAARSSVKLLEAQARRFSPSLVSVFDEKAAADLRVRLADTDIRVASGEGGLTEAAVLPEADTAVTAVVGTVGLKPTLAAIKAKKRIALANKETLVCAGSLVMAEARANGAEILPVDSEHSAIFQCIGAARRHVKRILLTASGGPFFGKSREELRSVTPEMALKHPNWSMGPKVTVDSATMMNKGLEIIEAMHLFSVPPEAIRVLVHRQSIVHSMVEFADNAVIAQLAPPDMRLPIQYALTYPERAESLCPEADFSSMPPLTFADPDLESFPCLRLAMETAKRPGTACAVMNAANEAAVGLFLRGRIGFYGIYESVAGALDRIENTASPTPEDILAADAAAREYVSRA
ncbi:MAG: 1-deoxy-D-xylulose-5-phosphate reductoisomerase [Oscillospiraceae bacterium]|nr:1-deoxy-D-xylulose-5-phosphate reductoisomerase [Oscillospiraceae bacterium]